MTWTAPDITRSSGSLVGPERELLDGLLNWHRETLLYKCAGLSGEQLATAVLPPSNLTLLGLIRHLAKVERIWFRERFAAEGVPRLYGDQPGKDADFENLDPALAEQDYARLVEEVRLARQAAATGNLDDTFTHDGTEYSLRFIYIHMIGEYARHNGHADILREHTDGVTGG